MKGLGRCTNSVRRGKLWRMRRLEFPSGFLWGAATSAHQVEGGCDRCHWWEWEQEGLRLRPGGYIRDGSVSGIACDYYHRYDDDHRLAASLGHRAQRISIEWSRIEPEPGRFDRQQVDHYKRVIDSIRRHGMVPNVTLHHFTNPIWAQRLGGFENPQMPVWLARYAAHVTREIGDRVDLWWTINEPMVLPALGYLLGVHPPCAKDPERARVVARHALLAHGRMYEAIHAAVSHPVRVGLVHNMPYFEPLDPESEPDRGECERADRLWNETVIAALREGVLIPPVGDGSSVPGLARSFDVLGLNYYMRVLVEAGSLGLVGKRRPDEPDRFHDEMGWEIYPEGLTRSLERLGSLGAPVYVTENGPRSTTRSAAAT
jgi:beta-glucosidase